jgi:hypothetical protein
VVGDVGGVEKRWPSPPVVEASHGERSPSLVTDEDEAEGVAVRVLRREVPAETPETPETLRRVGACELVCAGVAAGRVDCSVGSTSVLALVGA